MKWTHRVSATFRAMLLSISAYAMPSSRLPGLDAESVERMRRGFGGQLTMQPPTRTRWYAEDLETAELLADGGDLSMAGQLCRSMDRDGVLAGTMRMLAGGLVRLPKRFRGPADMVDALQQGGVQARSVFEEMLPASDLERFVSDAVKLGVAIGELVPVEGREYPVFIRHSPEYLVFRHAENRWYFRSAMGLLPIDPGDGRWVLHTPGGRQAPWQGGLWRALGRAYITKDHARNYRDNWESKLANPARVAVSPQGAAEKEAQSWFQKVMAWGVNSVFGVNPGYDVKLLESNGRGYESWSKTIAEQNTEIEIAIAGQVVTTTGGTGFSNAGVHEAVKADIIKATADALSHTINTQVLPAWVLNIFGEDRLHETPTVEWDVTPPEDLTKTAAALTAAATAIKAFNEALAADSEQREVDVEALCTRFGVPLRPKSNDLAANERPPSLALVREAA